MGLIPYYMKSIKLNLMNATDSVLHNSRLSETDSSAMWSYLGLSKVVRKVRNDNFKMRCGKRSKFRILKFTNIETLLCVDAAGL